MFEFLKKIVYNKYWFLFVIGIIIPLNVVIICNGDVITGFVLILFQVPYILKMVARCSKK